MTMMSQKKNFLNKFKILKIFKRKQKNFKTKLNMYEYEFEFKSGAFRTTQLNVRVFHLLAKKFNL